ncbi:MAG: phospholipase D family protein [Betaproteobacteria bacterium]|nr:phospholipase D family protein [Betaproteobacteria bacterium]
MKKSLMKKILTALSLAFLSGMVSAAKPLPPDATFDVGFSPRRGALEVVTKGIKSAKESILVASYSFTSKPIATALLAAHKRGIKVRVVTDAKGDSSKYTAARFLANRGVPVRFNDRYAIHHNKFMVIDGRHVETGSFNFSAAAADKNAENVLLLWNVKPLAEQYTAEWQRLWNEGVDMKPAY